MFMGRNKAIPRYYNLLACRLLEVAAAEFFQDGCTDFYPKLLDGISLRSRSVLLEDFSEWYQSTFHVPVPSPELRDITIDEWMGYIAWKLSGKPLSPQI
jgi:hypothetical protein